MNVCIELDLDDEIHNETEALASLKEKSGMPGHVAISDWNSFKLLGILNRKTGAMHWRDGSVLPDYGLKMHAYEEKLKEEKEAKWGKRFSLLK
jgi:hypothetical protein